LIQTSAPYWAGEYKVAYKYFTNGARTPESDVRWMRVQMFKEWTGAGVYGDRGVTISNLVRRAGDALDEIAVDGNIGDLDEISGLLQFALDEFNHYSILCRAYKQLVPDNTLNIEQMGDLEEGNELVAMRYKMRESELGTLSVDLSEGGGLGMYMAINDVFNKSTPRSQIDEQIKAFARATVNDEREHMAHRFSVLLEAGLEPGQWEEVTTGLQQISKQKLRERNQQFSGVYNNADLDKFGRDADSGRQYVQNYLDFMLQRFDLPPA